MPIHCEEKIASQFVTWQMRLNFITPPRKDSNWTLDEKTNCWNWNSVSDRGDGYGVWFYTRDTNQGQQEIRAHRMSYLVYVGDIPEDTLVLHKCNNRACVNPEHLYLGDTDQNMLDKVAAGNHLHSKETKKFIKDLWKGDYGIKSRLKSGSPVSRFHRSKRAYLYNENFYFSLDTLRGCFGYNNTETMRKNLDSHPVELIPYSEIEAFADNNQKSMAKKNLPANKLLVTSMFETIQGEGPFSGRPAVFVRFSNCCIQCPSCDTDYTSEKREVTEDEVLAFVSTSKHKLIVLTGGEPALYNLGPLVDLLHQNGYTIQIETNGILPFTGLDFSKVTIVCSPKADTVHEDMQHAAAWKYVVNGNDWDAEDGLPRTALNKNLPGKRKLARPINDSEIYIQPMDTKNKILNHLNLQEAVYIVLHYGHRLCLQVHKIIGVA